MQKLYLILITLAFYSCCKEPLPCNVQYFADVEIQEQGDYTLLIDNVPVDSWKGSSRTVDISERYTGAAADFRLRREIDLGGPNIDVLNLYSDVYRDSVRVESPELLEIGDQTSSGTLWLRREGGKNKITVRNSLECPSQARLVYNGLDTVFNLAGSPAGTEGGTDHVFYTNDSVFNITFQLLTPCEFWPREVMRVSSSSIQPFDFPGLTIGVRKEDCETIKK
jgi:hypothetical protein